MSATLAVLAAIFFATAALGAPAPRPVTGPLVSVHGGVQVELALDELQISWADKARHDAPVLGADTSVVRADKGRTIVSLSGVTTPDGLVAKAREIERANAGAAVHLVIYTPGLPKKAEHRRLLTGDVAVSIADGKSAADVLAGFTTHPIAGHAGAWAVQGSALAALDTAAALARRDGVRSAAPLTSLPDALQARLARKLARASKPKPFNKPQEAADFFARKRTPVGESGLPMERYLTAREHVKNMPVHSTSNSGAVSPSLRAMGLTAQTAGNLLGSWTPLGPGNVGGRTRSILIHPTTPTTMYAAGVAGGVWKSTDSGASWTPMSDLVANLAVTTLAFDPSDPNTIYAGTGEGFFNGDAARGAGIFRSTNGGVDWTLLPFTLNNLDFRFVNKIALTSSTTVYAATRTGVWRSADAGVSWTRVVVPVGPGCGDLAVRTDVIDTLFAACGLLNTRGTIHRGVGGVFTQVFAGEAGMSRMALAIAPSQQATIYALASTTISSTGTFGGGGLHAVFKSTDGGTTWTETVRNTSPAKINTVLLTNPIFAFLAQCFPGESDAYFNQGWYDSTIAVDPVLPTRVWVGGIDLFRSDDGGASWGVASAWTEAGNAHADQHTIVFHPGYNGTSNQTMFVGNDGGIYRTTNPNAATVSEPIFAGSLCGTPSGVAWTKLNNGYGVTQFYHGLPYPGANGGATFFGGTQDNGTVRGTAAGGQVWSSILGGDGGDVAIDPTNTNILYAENTDASIQRSDDGGATFADKVTGLDDGFFLFIAPFVMDPNDPSILWSGGSTMRRTVDRADTWVNAGSSCAPASSVSAIAVAPGNSNLVLHGTDETSGCIGRTTIGTTATSATVWSSTTPRSGYVSWLAFDPTDSNIAYATYATFGGAHVWRSTNGGQTFTSIDGSGDTAIPDIPVHTIVVDPNNPARLYLGTDLGVFVSRDTGATWAVENTGFANVITESLALGNVGGVSNIFAFTHGRGAWRVASADVPINSSLTVTVTGAGTGTVVDGGGLIACPGDCTETFLRADATPVTLTATAAPGSYFAGWSGTGGCTGIADCNLVLSGDRAVTATFQLVSTFDFSEATYTVAEGATTIITVHRTGGTLPVTVHYATGNGTATAGSDYTSAFGTLSFALNDTTRAFAVTTLPDSLAEGPETINLTLSSPSTGAVLGPTSEAVLTITDDDLAGTVQFSTATFTTTETALASTATVTVTRTGGIASGVTVQYTTSDGTGIANTHYMPRSGTLLFNAGVMSQSFTIPVLPDTLADGSHTVNLTLSNPLGGAALGAPATATLTILDNDVPGVLKFGAPAYSVAEGGVAALMVTRSLPVGSPAGSTLASNVSVDVASTGGSALGGGVDYTSVSQTLTFAAGQTSMPLPVTTIQDTLVEGNETVLLTLSNPTAGATIAPVTAAAPNPVTLTILDNDAGGVITFSPATYSVAEGGTATIRVMRTGTNLASGVTVAYATSNGTASAGSDYTSSSGVLSFGAGETIKTFTVDTIGDSVGEANETVILILGSPTGGATLGAPSTAVLTIIDNDPGLRFSSTAYSAVEGTGAVITVVRNPPATGAATVQFATTNGTAVGGTDYTGISGTLTFVPGVVSRSFTVVTAPNTVVEGPRTVTLMLGSPSGTVLGAPTTAVLTINDNDHGGVIGFSAPTFTVVEGGTASIVVNRTGANLGAATVDFAFGGTATGGGVDYTATAGTLSFAVGQISRTISIPTINDTIREGSETVTVTLSNPTGSASIAGPNPATLIITDNDAAGVFRFSAAAYTANRAVGTALITVTRAGVGLGSNVAVTFATTSTGTARDGIEYTATTGTLTFGAGETSKTFGIDILPGGVDPLHTTINLALSSPTNSAALTLPSTAVLTLTNTSTGVLEFSSPTYAVIEGGMAAITVNRAAPLTGTAIVSYATSSGSATAGLDYTARSGTLTFGPGIAVMTFVVATINDTIDEPDETVTLTLSNPLGGATLGPTTTATLTIVDNNSPGTLQFSAPTYSVTEGTANAIITVSRTGGGASGVTVNFATSDGTADSADYTSRSLTLTFNAGEIAKTVLVPIINDSLFEGPETVNLTLTSPGGGATLGAPSTATLTIVSNDPSGVVQFSPVVYTVNEQVADTAFLRIVRTPATSSGVLVDYTFLDGSAANGTDYIGSAGTLTFNAGETTKTIPVLIVDRSDTVGPRAFTVALAAVNGSAVSPTAAIATVNINRVDAGTLEFSLPTFSVSELVASATITVKRNPPLTPGTVTVNYATGDGTATAGSDYRATSGTLTFAPGIATMTFAVPIINDNIVEPTESVNLTLSNPLGGARLGAQSTATLNISDNDAVGGGGMARLSSPAYSVKEGGTATITVLRSGGTLAGGVTVDFATSDDGSAGSGYYTPTSGTLTFGPGQTARTFTVVTTPDTIADNLETVILTLSNPSPGLAIDGLHSSAVLTLVDDDTNVRFDSAIVDVRECQPCDTTITVMRTGINTGISTIDYTTADGTAVAGVDYVASAGTLTFAPGEMSKSIVFSTLPNATSGCSVVTAGISLSSPTGATTGLPTSTTINISDADCP